MKKASSSSRSRQSTPSSRRRHIFQTLLSASLSSDFQGLKLPDMKSLYYILSHLSLKTATCFSEIGASSNGLDMKLKFVDTDLHMISDLLFKELDEKFECYYSSLTGGKATLHLDISTDMEELTLLLRCCMVILTLSASDQTVLLKKCRVICSILSKIFSLYMIEGNNTDSVSLKKESASLYLCTLLEVFADELLTHKSLREYLMLVDCTSLSSEMLFACHYCPGDIGSVLEVMSYHFILSIPDDHAFEDFLEQLFWNHGRGFKIPELSMTAALALLTDPIILSAPKMFQAHLILLVSEAINSGMSSGSLIADRSLMSFYLTAFEKSVILYSDHMPTFHNHYPRMEANFPFAKSSTVGRSSHLSFEYYLKQDTRDKIHHVVSESNHLFDSGLCDKFFKTKVELVATSIAYMRENQHALDETCKDGILSILGCILQMASDDDANNAEVCGKLDISLEETCLLGAIMKLMSGSLLQAVLCTRRIRSMGGPEISKGSFSKEYNFIMKIAGSFQDFKASLPIQKFLCDMIKGQRMKHKEFKWILLHFSGLLSLSLVCGLDFLVKNCIFMIMTLLNLVSLVENDLAMLMPLLGCESDSCLHDISPARVHETRSNRKATQKVASNFVRIQRLHLSTDSQTSCCREEENERTFNGESFLKCVLDRADCQSYNIDDLADFVECKRGKDYSGWLKVRQEYRTLKERKRAAFRMKKMNRMWKLFKGNRL